MMSRLRIRVSPFGGGCRTRRVVRWFVVLCCAVAFCALMGVRSNAQVNTGTLSGQVTDASGAVVPEATLTVKDDNTGYTREVKSSGDGDYVFPDLPIGQYTITVEAPGFQTLKG